MTEPVNYAWLIPDRLAVGERPGGGGRSHRILRREDELAWLASAGVATIVSAMRTRHGLLEAALAGFRISWHPLVDEAQAAREVPALVTSVRSALDASGGAVFVHVDRPGPWLAGVDAALRLAFGLAPAVDEAVAAASSDGFPVDDVTVALAAAARC